MMLVQRIKLEDLVCMEDPEDVFEECKRLLFLMFPNYSQQPLEKAFEHVRGLFLGRCPGYFRCNTRYHDLKHTTDCLMALIRLIHGAHRTGVQMEEGMVTLALITALMHDTGYVQTADDVSGTGAKYTLNHIERSICFMKEYFDAQGYSAQEFAACRDILRCTGLDVQMTEIRFQSGEHEMLGMMLGASDLLGQMADRTYLERLPFLFQEFKEGGVPGFESELDLLRKTPGFWEFTKKRFETQLGNVDRYMLHHFLTRWGIDSDLYREAIENNISYLKYILEQHPDNYSDYLRRGGLIKLLRERQFRADTRGEACKGEE
ncbi:MAG TPA: hypothetical protein PLM79_02135 [Syntrophobacteraceae bacterium]|nr:hypothetical protein [Syntrophobacteraceae bacterium]